MEILGYYIFIILIKCAWGIICHEIAEKRNRNSKLAFTLGFLFGLWGVIGYAIAGNKKI